MRADLRRRRNRRRLRRIDLGSSFDGAKLFFLSALLMQPSSRSPCCASVARSAIRGADQPGNAPRLLGYGLGSGAFSGFFGIGGGLIVPGIVAATGMPMINAVGT